MHGATPPARPIRALLVSRAREWRRARRQPIQGLLSALGVGRGGCANRRENRREHRHSRSDDGRRSQRTRRNYDDDGNRRRQERTARKAREYLTGEAVVIDRVQRTAGNVGEVVVVLPGVFVQRVVVVAGRSPMMLVFGSFARNEISADPRQRTGRRKHEGGEGERRDDSTPARRPPTTGWASSAWRHDHRTRVNSTRMIRIPV